MIARTPSATASELINVALTREQVKNTVWALKKILAFTVEVMSFREFRRDCPILKAEHDAQSTALALLRSALDQQLSSSALPPASPEALGARNTLVLTDAELLQVELGLEERIDTLHELVERNKTYPASQADVEDWREQIDVATALLERVQG